jgi:hypothetical protein
MLSKISFMNFFIIGFIATVFSIPTLWLIGGWIKYVFFILELATIFVICLSFYRRFFVSFVFRIPIFNYLDYILLLVSSILFLLNFLNTYLILNVVLALIVSSFLPGYAILRLTKLCFLHNPAELIVLSFGLSIPVDVIMMTFLRSFSETTIILSTIYLVISLMLFAANRVHREQKATVYILHEPKKYSLTNFLLLLLVVIFFIVFICLLYPMMVYAPGFDIVRQYTQAQVFLKTTQAYPDWYPFFTIYRAAVSSLSSSQMSLSQMPVLQTSMAFMSVMVILSFYNMANVYLKKFDDRLPVISTICWVLLSGFGWIYLAIEKVKDPFLANINYFGRVSNISFGDVGSGLGSNLFLWFRAQTVSFTILFLLLYLMKRYDISRKFFIFIFSILVTTLFFTHFPELVMLVLLFFILFLFNPKIQIRLKDALASTVIGLLPVIPVSLLFRYVDGIKVPMPSYLVLILFIITLFSYFLFDKKRCELHLNEKLKVKTLMPIFFLILFISGFIVWELGEFSFAINLVGNTGSIPWFIYPISLGVVGLLGLISILVCKKLWNDSIVLFVFLLFSSVILGRIVSIINSSFFQTGYVESRFLLYTSVAAALLAPLVIYQTINFLQTRKRFEHIKLFNKPVILTALLIGIIVFSGISSTLLTVESYADIYGAHPEYLLTKQDLAALSSLSSVSTANSQPVLLTVSDSSINDLQYIPTQWIIDNYLLPSIWASSYPELPSVFLYNGRYSEPYIYLSPNDLLSLTASNWQNGYLTQHLLPNLPMVYSSSNITIQKVLSGVPAVLNGAAVLVEPFNNQSNNYLYAFDAMSLGEYNFTTKLDCDPSVSSNKIIVLSTDESAPNLIDGLLTNPGSTLIVFNTNGYGSFSNSFLNNPNDVSLSTNSYSISFLNGTVTLPVPISVSSFSPVNGTEVLAWYNGNQKVAPLVSSEKIGQSELIYVNIYPLINAMLTNKTEASNLYPLLGTLLEMTGVDIPKYNNVITPVVDDVTPVFIFKGASLNGNITVNSDYLFFGPETKLENVTLQTGKNQVSYQDIKSISFETANSVTISSQAMQIADGQGFYSNFISNSSKIILNGSDISLILNMYNGTSIDYTGNGDVVLSTTGYLQMYVHAPNVYFNGQTEFTEAYAFHAKFANLNTLGQNLYLNGSVHFSLPLSDKYSLSSDMTWNGSLVRDPPIFQWNELKSIEDSASVLILTTVIFLALFIFSTKVKRLLNRK